MSPRRELPSVVDVPPPIRDPLTPEQEAARLAEIRAESLAELDAIADHYGASDHPELELARAAIAKATIPPSSGMQAHRIVGRFRSRRRDEIATSVRFPELGELLTVEAAELCLTKCRSHLSPREEYDFAIVAEDGALRCPRCVTFRLKRGELAGVRGASKLEASTHPDLQALAAAAKADAERAALRTSMIAEQSPARGTASRR